MPRAKLLDSKLQDVFPDIEETGFFRTYQLVMETREPDELKNVKEAVNILVIIGSGITVNNIERHFRYACAFIIGSHFKEDGSWKNEFNSTRVKTFMEKFQQLRN